MSRWASEEGLPHPLGVSRVPGTRDYNFALYSRWATDVTLLLFRRDDVSKPHRTFPLDPFRNKTQSTWHIRLRPEEVAGAELYAYRVDGPPPRDRFHWHAFDPDKILFDPYARSLWFPSTCDRDAAMQSGSTMGKAPLGEIEVDLSGFDWEDDRPPRHEHDLVIYEMHVRGFTKSQTSGVSPDLRGTYAGVIEKIPYLRELGITAVELLPVYQYDPLEKNYWGYMPISFFAPHAQYARGKDARDVYDEFRSMVRAFHKAGIEVILDVVYNHTGEGNHDGPVYSLKGIDNSSYYIGTGDPAHPYENFSGTGNAIRACSAPARRLILDSLRWWVQEMHVDGFRFDLASVLARKADGSVDPDPPIFAEIEADPVLANVRFIAEPWDAAGLYQVGRAFPGKSWKQWNDHYRDDLRRFVRGDAGLVGAVMGRIYGSTDLFPDDVFHACRPSQSVNYVTCHDGFTLYDLVSYNHKHNEANGHGNRDGHHENYSWNHGVEGDEKLTPEILDLRKRQAKNFCALLFVSAGTPMFLAGDEFLQTQGGNNNPFNQDNETSWLDWRRLEQFPDVFRFFREMIAFRKAHPTFCRSRFWRSDIAWHGVGRHVDLSHESRSLAWCLQGKSESDSKLYVMANMYTDDLEFTIQEGRGSSWARIVDTALPSPDDIVLEGRPVPRKKIVVRSRSVVILASREKERDAEPHA